MKLEIFDVEHGQCSLLTSRLGTHLMVDTGHNGTTKWRPSTMLRERGIGKIDRLFITNYDEDHASDLHNVIEVSSVNLLHRNRTVSADNIYNLKELGGVGNGIEALCAMIGRFTVDETVSPNFGAMTYQAFWNRYPDDFEDENNLSMLVVLKWPNFSIAYTGDLEVAGWKKLLERAEVRAALKHVSVFMASHHGRMNGYCEEIFTSTSMQPQIIVVSDSGIDYETQKTGPLYRKHAAGFIYNNEHRRVFTTRRDGNITFDIESHGISVSTSKSGPRLF